MQIFAQFLSLLSEVPEWVPLFLLPALLALAAILHTAFGARPFYAVSALSAVGMGTAVVAAKGGGAVAYLGLTSSFAALLGLLFFVPKRKRSARMRKAEKLAAGLCAVSGQRPPKVCRFEEERFVTAEESGMQLSYAEELLSKLRRTSLAAADRVEAEALSRTLQGCRAGRLTEEEIGRLNDCLASVLKLTAKYKL